MEDTLAFSRHGYVLPAKTIAQRLDNVPAEARFDVYDIVPHELHLMQFNSHSLQNVATLKGYVAQLEQKRVHIAGRQEGRSKTERLRAVGNYLVASSPAEAGCPGCDQFFAPRMDFLEQCKQKKCYDQRKGRCHLV